MGEPTKPRGRRGDGTIFTTKDGRHRAKLTIPDAVTGKPTRVWFSGRTPTEVRKKLQAARSAAHATGKTPTLSTYCEGWLRLVKHRVRPATMHSYRGAIRVHVIPALGHVELARLLPSHVEGMTAAMLERGLRPSTAALARRVLVVAITDAERDGLVTRNAARLARPPRMPDAPPRALSDAERRRLIHLAREDDDMGPLVMLALATGLRRSELLALTWSDIDMEKGTLTVSATLARAPGGGYRRAEPKTRRSRRTITLPALGREALMRQQDDTTGYVFQDALGQPRHPETVTSAWSALARRARLDGVRLHDLRHSLATALLAAGSPVRDVADLLGHASPSITLDVYGGSVPEGPRRVADIADRVLGGES